MNEGIRDHSTGLNRVDEDAQSIRSTSHASPEEPHAINDRFDSLESRILVVEHSDAELSRRLHSAVAKKKKRERGEFLAASLHLLLK